MPVIIFKSGLVIHFGLTDDLAQRIDAWKREQDSLVFQEQVATGEFRGKFKLRDTDWDDVKRKHAQGKIRPYYGAIGGAYSYHFQINQPRSSVKVTHALLDEHFEVNTTTNILKQTIPKRLKNFGKGGHSEKKMPLSIPTQFTIAGRELGKLRAWKHWDNVNCFSGRYIYTFRETGLGVVIKVTDTKKGKKIDITEYDGW